MPAGAPVGLTGLEREFDERLTGTPGGTLFAGDRVLAERKAKPGQLGAHDDRPEDPAAAVEALAGRYGGIAVVRPDNGEVLALAGIAQSAPQPPGSTFKIVTLAGVLEEKVAKRSATFPVQTAATIEGVELQNANGESCGGSLRNSFAHSCNSVFAPLGAELGAEKLVEYAAAVRLQRRPGARRRGALDDPRRGRDRRRPRGRLVRDRPGQGARDAAADGARRRHDRRRRPAPAADAAARRRPEARPRDARLGRPHDQELHAHRRRATAPAAWPRSRAINVAGKTGTAELRTTVKEEPPPEVTDPNAPPPEDDTTDTDAWFVALRALPQAEDRRRGDARRPGHGRRHRRARGRAWCSRPRSTRGRGRRRGLFAAARLDLELQRAVLQRVGLEAEEDQRALDRAARPRRCPGVGSTCACSSGIGS